MTKQPYVGVSAAEEEYVNSIEDAALRETVVCVLSAYRRPDRLSVGDPVPALDLMRMDTGEPLSLAAKRDRPLILFFGSYT